MNITIRQATAADKDFLIDAIIEAEKGGSDSASYCTIFSITENELRQLLGKILDEETPGQELYIPNFLIAEADGERAGALSGWIENEDGMASSIIKINLIMYFLDRAIVLNAAPALKLMSEVNIHRTEYTLQTECCYVVSKFRGLGIGGKLMDEHARLHKGVSKMQLITYNNNEGATRAWKKNGYKIIQEKRCTNEAILKLLPCDTKILMERKLSN